MSMSSGLRSRRKSRAGAQDAPDDGVDSEQLIRGSNVSSTDVNNEKEPSQTDKLWTWITEDLMGTKMDNVRMSKRRIFIRNIIVFVLILDTITFTSILPLFPKILGQYSQIYSDELTQEKSLDLPAGSTGSSVIYPVILSCVHKFADLIGVEPYAVSSSGRRMDIVLFGGFVSSIFTFSQFLISPFVGTLADRYGRRFSMLLSITGSLISMIIWMTATTFDGFVISRFVTGITKSNLQMSITIAADISPPELKSRQFALIGIAFSLGGALGPNISAYLADYNIVPKFLSDIIPTNQYSSPALAMTLILLVEWFIILVNLPDTRKGALSSMPDETPTRISSRIKTNSRVSKHDSNELDTQKANERSAVTTKKAVPPVYLLHFLFLFSISGVDFLLPFLTNEELNFANSEQALLLCAIGIVSATTQMFYTRRVLGVTQSEASVVLQGTTSATLSAVLILLLPVNNVVLCKRILFGINIWLIGFTLGTTSTALTSVAAKYLSPGAGMGRFRACGQLGRTFGPIFMCSTYWMFGFRAAYSMAAGLMVIATFTMWVTLKKHKTFKKS